jgi:hypothetical protein
MPHGVQRSFARPDCRRCRAHEAVVRDGAEARYTIDWLENLPTGPFVWPDFVGTKTENATTRTIGFGDDGITLFSTDYCAQRL